MAVTVKLFHFIRNYYQKLGIYPHRSFNLKNVLFISAMIQMSVATGAYFLFKAKNLDEMGTTFYATNSVISAIFYFVSNIQQSENILLLIEKLDEFIKQSKLKLFY